MSVVQGEPDASVPAATTEPASTEAAPPRLARVPALDGLRGLAVAAVLLFHGGYLTGGWLGVDLFFVLSGYLITSLLLLEHRTDGAVRLGAFWGRRARRLLPALLVMVIAVSVYAWLDVAAIDLGAVRSDGLATLFFVANWHDIISGASYWDRGLAPSMFAHTWSLAVEEQLYLVWPLILVAVLRRRPDRSARTIARVALGLAALSAAVAIGLRLAGASEERIYLGTDTRAVAVFLGAFVAGWRRTARRSAAQARQLELVAMAAGIVLLLAWWGLDGTASVTYWGGLLGASVLAAVVVAAAADPRSSTLGGLLGARPLVGLGLISYGLYLWHWPVYIVLSSNRTGLDGLALLGARLLVTFAISIASYLLLERPVRSLRPAGWWEGARGRAYAVAAMAFATVVLLAATLGAVSLPTAALDDGVARPTAAPSGLPKVVILGDSVAASIAAPVIDDPDGFGIDAVRSTVNGCQAVWDGEHRARGIEGDVTLPPACPAKVPALVEAEQPDAVLVLYGGWTDADFQLGGEWLGPCDAAYEDALRVRFAELLAEAGSSGAPVFVATAPRSTNTFRRDDTWDRTACSNAVMTEVAAATDGVEVIDLDAWLCPDGACRERIEGTTVRSDGVHFQGPGGSVVSQWLLGEVVRGAGLEVGELDQDRKDTPEYRAIVRVCSSYADLSAITQGQVAELMASQEARDGLVDSLDNFDAATMADLPPEVADDLDGLADPQFQAWGRTLLDRLAAGEQIGNDELPRVTVDGVALGLERLRTLC